MGKLLTLEEIFHEMQQGNFTDAEKNLKKNIQAEINSYELYYAIALCHEHMGKIEDAYFEYKLALFLGKGSSDQSLLENAFQALCENYGANEYELGKSCERLVTHRIQSGEYEVTEQFLNQQLYDTNRYAANIVLTEENMLLHMMIEIVLCEKQTMTQEAYERENLMKKCHCNVKEFKPIYTEIKLMIRRIRFGLSVEEQRELNTLVKRLQVSAGTLVVIAKYAVTQGYWIDTFKRMQAVLQYQYPQLAQVIGQYIAWMNGNHIGGNEKCEEPDTYHNGITVKKCDCKEIAKRNPVEEGNSVVDVIDRELDEAKISIIYCTNDARYAEECNLYLSHLRVPGGFSVEIMEVWNATGMAAGYNVAMKESDARYKIYIHQDTFIINSDALIEIIERFKRTDYKMLGIAGTKQLPKEGFWFKSRKEDMRMMLYQDIVLDILQSKSIVSEGTEEEVQAMDGIFLATSADVKWREDLFDHWHFYDISQCFEFRRSGYQIAAINDKKFWVFHETTAKKDASKSYEKYCKVFLEEYQDEMNQ